MIIVLGGSAAARLQHTGMIFSYSFFLPALLFLEIALERRSFRFGLLFSVSAALMALGRDQVAFLCCLAVVWAVISQASTSPSRSIGSPGGCPLLAAMALGIVALLAVPGPPDDAVPGGFNRPAFAYGVAAMNSLPPSSLATLIAPNVFGTLNLTYDYWGPMWDTMPEGTYTDRAVNYLFAGTLPLVAAAVAGPGARPAVRARAALPACSWASPRCSMPSADTRPSSSCCSTISPVSSSTVARRTRRSSSTSPSRSAPAIASTATSWTAARLRWPAPAPRSARGGGPR